MILTCELEKEEKHYHRDDTQWMIPCQSTEQLAMLGVIAFWCLWTNWIITAISDFEPWILRSSCDGFRELLCWGRM